MMLAPRFIVNPLTYLGVLSLLASGCRNVPTNGALGDLDRGVDQTTERALPPPHKPVSAPSATALLYVPAPTPATSSSVGTGNTETSRRAASSDAPAASSDSGSEGEGAVAAADAGPPDPMRLDVTVADLDVPSCSVWVDGEFSLEEKDLAVYLLAPDGKNPRSLGSSKPEACMPSAVRSGANDAGLDAGPALDAAAPPPDDVNRLGAWGTSQVNDAGLTVAEAGWFLSARDEGTFLEFCPDGCAHLKRLGGRLLIDVRWGVRFYAR